MAKTQKGLGKGLGALFVEAPAETLPENPSTLPLRKLEPNPDQPRRDFDEASLAELADSISKHGLLQPIAVRPTSTGYYQIIAGERRWRAARQAGLDEVPVVIRNADDSTAAQLALIENLQREDLNPLEEARGYQTLMEAHGMTQEQAADSVGKSRPAVANALRLLKLPETVQALVAGGSLSAGHARALIPLGNEKRQKEAAETVIAGGLSVRQTEQLVKRLMKPEKQPVFRDPLAVDYIKECETDLARRLGRRVIIQNGKKKGSLTLEFHGDEDLQVLLDLLEKL